jgi:hypothetical protein
MQITEAECAVYYTFLAVSSHIFVEKRALNLVLGELL